MRFSILVPAALLALAAEASAGTGFKEVHKTLPLDPEGLVSIETFKGWITVTTWDQPEVEVSARVEPDESGRDQERKVEETVVRIEGSSQRVRIESDYDRVRHGGFLGIFGTDNTLPFVRYTLKLPRKARLEIKDYKSESRVDGLQGAIRFDTYKGRVELSGLTAPVRLETYKGEVRVQFARFSESRFETYKGDVEITVPRDAAFALDADLGRHGTLSSDLEVLTRVSGDRERRRGTVNGGGPRLELDTYKGGFHLRAR
jgi:hypothetical protein